MMRTLRPDSTINEEFRHRFTDYSENRSSSINVKINVLQKEFIIFWSRTGHDSFSFNLIERLHRDSESQLN